MSTGPGPLDGDHTGDAPAEHHDGAVAEVLHLDGGSGRPGDATTEQLMTDAIGGWRGLVDGSLPSAVFLVVYIVSGSSLQPALIGAIGAGVLIAVLRLVRRQSLQQVVSGFVGVAFCAWFASRTGNAGDFYLPGLLINVAYGTALAISCLVGHPLLGYAVGAATGDLTGWRQVPEQRRAYALATWFFVAVFFLRLLVQVPLYLADMVAALGTAKLFMGWPLFALAAFLAYRVISKARREAPVPVPAAPDDGA
jgi:hypothetical protein